MQVEPFWLPVHEPSLDGCCSKGCELLATAAVVLVDSGAIHSFVSQAIVDKHGLPVHQVDSMQIFLADGHVFHSKTACVVPLVVCVEQECALYSVVSCCVLDDLSSDVFLGIDWLQSCNPVIDWHAYTVALPVQDEQVPRVVAGLPVGPVAEV